MPPKKNKVNEQKVKKFVEDKTFGLKNKNKSKKVQQYVAAVSASATQAGKSHKQLKAEEAARKAKAEAKKAAEQAKKEQAELFKTVVKETKVPVGVDPKSVLCEFFKVGRCQKGAKCKYSHDMNINLKSQRIDVYSDPRDLAADTIDKWDTDKLNAVVQKKAAGRMPPTDIVCKFFLDAIENGQYGWFWECENGPTCHYRHALPPGYVLKPKTKDIKDIGDEDEDQGPTIEEEIEEERKKLDLTKCTPLTLEGFKKWKQEKIIKKEKEIEQKRKEAEKKGGAAHAAALHGLSGRDLFRYDPSLFVDDAEADDEQYEIAENNEEEEKDGQQQEEEEKDRPLYDPTIQGEVDIHDVHDEGDEEEKQRASDTSSTTTTSHTNDNVDKLTTAIDADLFLDEDVPDDDDDDEEEEEEEEDQQDKDDGDEKKS